MEDLRKVISVGKPYQSKCISADMPYCPMCPFSICVDAPEDEYYENWDCEFEVCEFNRHWLIENDDFQFCSAEEYDGELFEVYIDIYGQSFVLAWVDPIDRKVQEWSCGSFNNYIWDMRDIAESIKRKREQNGEKN